MGQKAGTIPSPVVRRLAKYLTDARRLHRAGRQWVSSKELAESLGLTSSTVRQDLSHIDICGVSKRGYETTVLADVLHRELGGDVTHRVIIIGAGNMGCALARHEVFAEHGFEVCGLFDANPGVAGRRVGRLTVLSMQVLQDFVQEWAVDLGILAVPADAAQEVADQLVAAGVRGILNLACAHIRVPEKLAVVDAWILEDLQELSHIVHVSGKRNAGV